MTRLTKLAAALAAGLLLVATGACNDDGSTAKPVEPPSSTTSSPSPSTDAERDALAAEKAVTAFWKRYDKYSNNPKSDITYLAEVAREESLAFAQQIISQQRSSGRIRKGEIRVEDVEAVKETKQGDWVVRSCVDVSDVTVENKQGKSVVSPKRPDRVIYRHVVEKDEGKFYVVKDEQVESC